MVRGKKKFAECGSYQRLKRQFCRRYGIDPRSEISRKDVIEDAVYAQLETDGETPAERVESVLSAIFFTLRLIASSQGIDPQTIEKYAGDVAATRPRKYTPPTQEELDERENEENRRNFGPFIKRLLAMKNQ